MASVLPSPPLPSPPPRLFSPLPPPHPAPPPPATPTAHFPRSPPGAFRRRLPSSHTSLVSPGGAAPFGSRGRTSPARLQAPLGAAFPPRTLRSSVQAAPPPSARGAVLPPLASRRL